MSIDRYLSHREPISRDEVSLGYRTVRLFTSDELSAEQEGYQGEGWSPDWLVIASEDLMGDPIFTDLAAQELPVFTAEHGAGTWEPLRIADSFEGFTTGLAEVASVSAGREHPVGLEENPIPDADRERVLARIREANPTSDIEFWESWFPET